MPRHEPVPGPETFDWDAEVEIVVVLKVSAKPGEGYEGLDDGYNVRTPEMLAQYAAAQAGFYDLSRIDGFADMVGSVSVEHTYPL